MNKTPYKTLIMHGFTKEEALLVMRTVKQAFQDPSRLIFALTTPYSVEKKLAEVLEDLEEEHRRMKGDAAE
ncbi:MAG: DUF3783 domain-containing protein [Spirochaetales bacterium]